MADVWTLLERADARLAAEPFTVDGGSIRL
jgi:hypothetical protein